MTKSTMTYWNPFQTENAASWARVKALRVNSSAIPSSHADVRDLAAGAFDARQR